MSRALSYTNPQNVTGWASIESEPNFCPICHHNMDPTSRGAYLVTQLPAYEVLIRGIYQCTRNECREPFVAYFMYKPAGLGKIHDVTMATGVFRLYHVAPSSPEPIKHPEEVAAVSPRFVEVYGQAARAEASGLDQVCGPGYRKALECLVKDYLIKKAPEAEQAIRAEFLGAAIKKRVTDTKLKSVAERAAWLGNDETHYDRKWVEKDLMDLKALIRLTVNWIDSELVTERYVEDMPPGGPDGGPPLGGN